MKLIVCAVTLAALAAVPTPAKAAITCDPTGTICPAEFLYISVGGGDSSANVAIADSGTANGRRYAPLPPSIPTVGISGTGNANGSIAVSGTGTANGDDVAVSGTGDATGARFLNVCPFGRCG